MRKWDGVAIQGGEEGKSGIERKEGTEGGKEETALVREGRRGEKRHIYEKGKKGGKGKGWERGKEGYGRKDGRKERKKKGWNREMWRREEVWRRIQGKDGWKEDENMGTKGKYEGEAGNRRDMGKL